MLRIAYWLRLPTILLPGMIAFNTLLAQTPKDLTKAPQPYPAGFIPIQIIPSPESVRLGAGPADGNPSGPWCTSASLKVQVRSFLPEWGVQALPVNMHGPSGSLPPERLWIRSQETGDEFTPLTRPVPVVRGDLRRPSVVADLEIRVQPSWQDLPGEYEGTLVMTPMGPEIHRQKSAYSSRKISSKYNKEPRDDDPSTLITPDPHSKIPFSGLPGQVHFSLSIPEIFEITLVEGGELSFQGEGPEGTYTAAQEVKFRVLTNSRSWRVIARADNLKSERGEIPADRIRWERVDGYGQVIERGTLGKNNVVLHSGGSPVSPEEVHTIRFSLDVTMNDVAGSYKGRISLQGITGN